MIRLDTIKLEVPEQAVRGHNQLIFTRTDQTDPVTGQVQTFYKAKKLSLPVGCSNIVHKEGGSYQMTISAKTLGQDYLQGISKNTIEQALSSVSDVLDIDTQTLLDINPQVYSFDVTDNISLESLQGSKRDVVSSLLATHKNDRFLPVMYNSKTKFGVEFRGTQKEKNRLICYDKLLDLHKRQNRDFIRSLPYPSKVYDQAKQTIRIESNVGQLKSARDRLSIPDNKLISILNSDEPVNHNFLMKIMNHKRDTQLDIFEEYKRLNLSPNKYVYLKGIQTIIAECEYNQTLIKQFFKYIYGDRFSYYFYKASTPIKKLIQDAMIQQSDVEEGVIISITDRLLAELLKTG